MRKLSVIVMAVAITGGEACAQQSTAVGIGTGVARARSDSRATAIGGGVGNTGTSSPSAVISTGNQPLSEVISTVPAQQSVKTVPSVFAPGLAAAGIESCLGSASGGGSWLGTGITLGGSIPDGACNARLDARTLWSMGLRKAAVARLCLSSDIYRSMPDVCGTYVPTPTGYIAPVAYRPYGGVAYNGGDIWLSHDGQPEQLCHDYDAPAQRCRVWASNVKHRSKRLKSDVVPTNTAALQKDGSR